MKATIERKAQKDLYLDLVARHPLMPIGSKAELRAAQKVSDELMDRFEELGEWERGYFVALGTLIKSYEDIHHPLESLPPHIMLAEMIEAKGVKQSEVAEQTSIPSSTLSELLSQKRGFTLDHVRKLCKYFRVGPEAFVGVEG